MVPVHRPAVDIAADGIASRFLLLNQRVVAGFADCFRVLQIEEQGLIALVGLLVIDHCRAGMVPVAGDQQAVAALTGVEVTE